MPAFMLNIKTIHVRYFVYRIRLYFVMTEKCSVSRCMLR